MIVENMIVEFKVIDRESGVEVKNPDDLVDLITEHNLGDNVQFAVLQDGGLIITDEYNNWVYVDPERYKISEVKISFGGG